MTLESLQNACQGNSTVANYAVVAAAVYAVTHYTTTYVRFKDEETPAQAAGHTPVEKSAGLFAAMVIICVVLTALCNPTGARNAETSQFWMKLCFAVAIALFGVWSMGFGNKMVSCWDQTDDTYPDSYKNAENMASETGDLALSVRWMQYLACAAAGVIALVVLLPTFSVSSITIPGLFVVTTLSLVGSMVSEAISKSKNGDTIDDIRGHLRLWTSVLATFAALVAFGPPLAFGRSAQPELFKFSTVSRFSFGRQGYRGHRGNGL